MSSNPMFALFDATAREGQRFADQFFKDLDARSVQPSTVLPQTRIVWNGTPLAGLEDFAQMISQSPEMKHEISGLDVQPFPNGDVNAVNMIVNTSGKVHLGTDKQNDYAFSAQLVVRRPQPGAALVCQTIAYRLVHKPANGSVQL